MRVFAELLDRLSYTPGRNAKLTLMADYFRAAPDPDRGYALAALTGRLDFATAKPAMIRGLVEQRVDPVLYGWSYDFVGDMAETVALIWPERPGANRPPELAEVVERLSTASRSDSPRLVEGWLDALDANGRWAFLKLITGGLRVGVSARLAKTALAQLGDAGLEEIEEIWHGVTPPFTEVFAWLEGRAAAPAIDLRRAFRPLMLANPLDEAELENFDPAAYRAEWKWDGIRVQLAAGGGEARLFSRSGDEITQAFPDLMGSADFDAVLDGELLVARDGEIAPFNDLQQRLNRKRVTAKMLQDFPAHLRVYDILFDGDEDLRAQSFDARRLRLEAWYAAVQPARIDLSPLLGFGGWDDLASLRETARARSIEGLMLKLGDSPYVAGRPKGPWFKWKRDALTLDTVLMYAQRGHGKRSSLYSDYTFGAWRTGEDGAPELVPVGKAYSGFTDEELLQLDKWVRANTTERFGPVRAVKPGVVLEVAFDAVHRSKRHKSGVAMRFPRIHRIRWDKPVEEADRLPDLEKLIEG
ncbi:cisplatin damage response ATP-dependent DNA ligase [Pelagibius litoralis]|uniref:DNA ligase (ATP) n=1 Tax=Pelagibius litoralis TaxID=374515 RepID=A0A967C4V7_9PROT|nr:cisplatin damage response ATP-dependent DNA ligase [Pelagibius litoralis]NIA68890.1 cisplatin damage response ATP-dependent DNA ligase [Pelagibius litoralis]